MQADDIKQALLRRANPLSSQTAEPMLVGLTFNLELTTNLCCRRCGSTNIVPKGDIKVINAFGYSKETPYKKKEVKEATPIASTNEGTLEL